MSRTGCSEQARKSPLPVLPIFATHLHCVTLTDGRPGEMRQCVLTDSAHQWETEETSRDPQQTNGLAVATLVVVLVLAEASGWSRTGAAV